MHSIPRFFVTLFLIAVFPLVTSDNAGAQGWSVLRKCNIRQAPHWRITP